MTQKKILTMVFGLSALAIGALCVGQATTAVPNSGAALGENEYIHYTGFAPTKETAGLTEYWTNCRDTTYTALPEGATVIDERQADADVLATIIAADPNDERIIPAIGYRFNEVTGLDSQIQKTTMVEGAFDLYTGDPSKGNATITETNIKVEGFNQIYNYKHAYTSGDAWSIEHMFADINIDDIDEIKFYIDSKGVVFMFAGDDNTDGTGFELHPFESYGTAGTITATNLGDGTWKLVPTGFRFRDQSNGAAATECTFHNRHTLNELFHRPSNGWGASEVYVSEIHLTGSVANENKAVTAMAFANPTKLVKQEQKADILGNMYKHTGGIRNSLNANFDVSGLTQIRFQVEVPDDGNTFMVKGNSSGGYGIYGGNNDTVVANKVGSTWTVRRASGKTFFDASWNNVTTYTVENATKLGDIFSFFSYGSDTVISDIVVKGETADKRIALPSSFFATHEKGSSQGWAWLEEQNNYVTGFGNTFKFSHAYNDGVSRPFDALFTDYSLTGVKSVEFWIGLEANLGSSNKSTIAFTSDEADVAYQLHPSAGAQNPGLIRAYQTSAGTWNVTSDNGLAFRKTKGGNQYTSYTVTGRNNLADLFAIYSGESYSSCVTVSTVAVIK